MVKTNKVLAEHYKEIKELKKRVKELEKAIEIITEHLNNPK